MAVVSVECTDRVMVITIDPAGVIGLLPQAVLRLEHAPGARTFHAALVARDAAVWIHELDGVLLVDDRPAIGAVRVGPDQRWRFAGGPTYRVIAVDPSGTTITQTHNFLEIARDGTWAQRGSTRVEIRGKCADLLSVLCSQPGRPIEIPVLIRRVWATEIRADQENGHPSDEAFDQVVRGLRKALETVNATERILRRRARGSFGGEIWIGWDAGVDLVR